MEDAYVSLEEPRRTCRVSWVDWKIGCLSFAARWLSLMEDTDHGPWQFVAVNQRAAPTLVHDAALCSDAPFNSLLVQITNPITSQLNRTTAASSLVFRSVSVQCQPQVHVIISTTFIIYNH